MTNIFLLSAVSGARSTPAPAPVSPITGLTPATFFNGSTVTITGTNLSGKTLTIYRGPVTNTLSATVESQTDTEVKLRITGGFANSNTTGAQGIAINGQGANYSGTVNFVASLTVSVTNAVAEVNVTPVTVTNSDNLSDVTFSVSPTLPSGLTLNTSTGGISGTPSSATGNTAVTYTLTATKTDSNIGGSVSRQFSLTVVTAEQKPARTCNTSGTSPGCYVSTPYSCTNNTTTCFSQLSTCRADSSCGF